MKHKLDKYDMILEKMGYNFQGNLADVETDTDNESLTELMNEIGIKRSDENEFVLIIHNDEVNDMMHVALALYEICDLNSEEAMRIMMEAHDKGKAVAKSGSFEVINGMKVALNTRGIEATVEN